KAFKGEARVATTSVAVMGSEIGPAWRIGCPHASSCFGSIYVTVQVAAISISPCTSCALTAEPGISVDGAAVDGSVPATELDDPPEPPAVTTSSPVLAICFCHRRTASGLNPLIISGVSIAWKFIPFTDGFSTSPAEFTGGGLA